jgi:DNA-3-methyladenine glycosylase
MKTDSSVDRKYYAGESRKAGFHLSANGGQVQQVPLSDIFRAKLPIEFYLQNCLMAAKKLIGKILVRKINDKIYAGIIVETEAYMGSKDAASHSYNGLTKRNEVMFESGGVCYVYFTYGNHYCINAVTREKGTAHAVLIRALEPVIGRELMKKNRGMNNIYNLTNGPGKLTQAFEIDKRLNGFSLGSKELFIAKPKEKYKITICSSKRIGITKNADKLWRFYAKSNPFVSGVNIKAILNKSKII